MEKLYILHKQDHPMIEFNLKIIINNQKQCSNYFQ